MTCVAYSFKFDKQSELNSRGLKDLFSSSLTPSSFELSTFQSVANSYNLWTINSRVNLFTFQIIVITTITSICKPFWHLYILLWREIFFYSANVLCTECEKSNPPHPPVLPFTSLIFTNHYHLDNHLSHAFCSQLSLSNELIENPLCHFILPQTWWNLLGEGKK